MTKHQEPPPKYSTEKWARYRKQTTLSTNPYPRRAHIIHATLTTLTCGLWSIVWIAHYLAHKNIKYKTTYWQ